MDQKHVCKFGFYDGFEEFFETRYFDCLKAAARKLALERESDKKSLENVVDLISQDEEFAKDYLVPAGAISANWRKVQ